MSCERTQGSSVGGTPEGGALATRAPTIYDSRFTIYGFFGVYLSVLAVAALWVGGAVLAPVALDAGGVGVAAWLYFLYSPVCHQIGERSLHIFGEPMAVCARCSGIYAGYILGLLVYPLARSLRRTDTPPRAWLFVLVAPAVIDFFGGYAGLFENSHASRLITGLCAGAAGAFFTLPGLVSLVQMAFNGNTAPYLIQGDKYSSEVSE